jgi:hypothetical protein
MADEPQQRNGVIPRDAVRRVSQPVMLDCGASTAGKGPLVVVPLMDGDRVAGLRVQCACGSSAVIECVYDTEVKT